MIAGRHRCPLWRPGFPAQGEAGCDHRDLHGNDRWRPRAGIVPLSLVEQDALQHNGASQLEVVAPLGLGRYCVSLLHC